MLKKIFLTLGLLILAWLLYAATKPSTFAVQRSVTIKAPVEKVYTLVDSLRAWSAWSPYEHLDSQMTKTYAGPPSGVGASWSWESKKAGSGRMTIIAAKPTTSITFALDFMAPMAAHDTAEFTFVPRGDSVAVTWGIHGPNPYAMKVVSTLMNVDAIYASDFDRGLASLKALAEKP